MAFNFLLKGMVIGLSIAAPVGPIGVLCIRLSLTEGQRVGFATGLGAATADAAYGCVAGFGLRAVSGFLMGYRLWLGLIGGLFLCYLGVRTFRNRPTESTAKAGGGGLFAAYLSTLLLTLSNPMTLFSFMAVFTVLGSGGSPDFPSASAFVAGVFIGSALWWLFLSTSVAVIGTQISAASMQIVNRLSGGLIFALGLYSLSTLLIK